MLDLPQQASRMPGKRIAKVLFEGATDFLCSKRIVFHHVAKCGGTSVGRALRRAYILSQGTITPEASFRAFAAAKGGPDREQLILDAQHFRQMMFLYLLYSDVRCIAAHVPFSNVAYELFQDRYAFTTILRAPVERFVSHYLWSFGKPEAYGNIEETFDQFLKTRRSRLLGATYVVDFCGRPFTSEMSFSTGIRDAISNLRRMSHVGFLDDMTSSQQALRALTGKRLRIGHENAGKRSSASKDILSGPLRSEIEALCAPDQEVWEAIQDLRTRGAGAMGKALGGVK